MSDIAGELLALLNEDGSRTFTVTEAELLLAPLLHAASGSVVAATMEARLISDFNEVNISLYEDGDAFLATTGIRTRRLVWSYWIGICRGSTEWKCFAKFGGETRSIAIAF
ncbi:hypothetical protein [Paenibacillus sp.]|uniref:hypothetical protein n=1 Tax=Paenibacillus sp. TaxID=58172 RepID=UPI0028123716|nr:hypothetical protein [Paenibacillus sp.]